MTIAPTRPASTRRLLDRLAAGTPFGLVFGGQGENWLRHLADLVRRHDVELAPVVGAVDELLQPVASELVRSGSDFDPLTWADTLAVGESAEAEEWPALPTDEDLLAPSLSLPGITLVQVAALRAVRGLGLDPSAAVAVAGHSQGTIAAAVVEGLGDVEAIAISRLAGVASEQVARRRGLLGHAMLSITGLTLAEIDAELATFPASVRVVAGVRNGRRSNVISGPADGIAKVQALFDDADTFPGVIVEPVPARAAFHHPDLAEAVDLVVQWAERCGIDPVLAADLARASLVDPVEWVQEINRVIDAGARWILDLGPGDLAARITSAEAAARGVAVVAPATRRGFRELTVAGAAPAQPTSWDTFSPTVVSLPDGAQRIETRFTRLTGRSPILLAGMTPTTVDPAIVAAAANAGYWAELAGGGQVSEAIFAENVGRLDDLLEPGRTYAFNSLFLDPYLWRLQVGGKRLVQKARANGSAVDAVIVTAGIPERDEAVELVKELQAAGIEYTVFKPGTVNQIKQVLAIADELAPTAVIVQIEGGKAGGHHSEEDLDHLLLETYAQLRRRDNVVVCVGGGIGKPADAVRYLTGAWSTALGFAAMPLDGVLIGTAAMAALEATTSPSVKQLLVDTTSDQVVSGRSQLGASIHEIDNTASRTGRLLDQVAGDLDAVLERRDEIVEALNRTAKPYFGDVAEMTYGQLLERFAALTTVETKWLDVTLRDRFHELLQRAEARLNPADHGSIPTLFAEPSDVEDGGAALSRLRSAYPDVDDVVLHPTDVHFFIDVCRRPGKPVTFVPIIDADVRQWWRSDSLWQAHDPRFDADAVCVIPGTAAVEGITQVDEPIADLLGRFESAVVDAVTDSGRRVDGLRRADGTQGPVALLLAAPDVDWDGRIVRNPVAHLGTEWVVVSPERAEHPETGAALVALADDVAGLAVPISSGSTLHFVLRAGTAVAAGAAPVVEDADATLGALLEAMAGGRSADAPVAWNPDLVADHAAVSEVASPVARFVPDVLVGLTWPAVFGALGQRPDVVSGVLDLVHLDHAIQGSIPSGAASLDVSAVVRSVADTEFGRVVTVDVTIVDGAETVATLVERFTLRGRAGAAELADPTVAGGSVADASVTDTPRRRRALVTVAAPTDLRAFAQVTGDHNPIHTSVAAARLAGLGAPIVHGMWVSAAAQRAVTDETGRTLTGWTARFLAPVRLGDDVQFTADRIGIVDGDEVVEVVARANGEVVLTATGRLAASRTAYVFPGQGIQSKGMGMDGYRRSRAAKSVWDRADAHTRAKLGFSILEVVRENPTELRVRASADADVQTFRHPDGVLFLTQFTQVAMAVLASAQVAELRESGAFIEGALTAGHSVGEYNALAAVTGVLTLEAVVEVVYQRGSVMHGLVPRDAEGRSDYRLAAIRPSQFDLADDDVRAFVAEISAQTGEFLEVANENLRGSQYVIAGTVRGCEAMADEIERRREAFGGRGAYVLVPGIDVPFHSRVLRGGVDSFRARLDELLPAEVDPAILVDRYVPNLVARPFSLDEDFLRSILEVVPAEAIEQVLANPSAWVGRDAELAHLVLVELLAWQFASPVRWIETQDLFFASVNDTVQNSRGAVLPGLGVERIIEVGVGGSPTLATIASQTIKLPRVARRLDGPVEVVNVERDAAAVFGTDEQPPEIVDDEPTAAEDTSDQPVAAAPTAAAAPAPARATGEPVADLAFGAGEAARLLIAWWTKVRPDQLGNADSIESLCDGASSRRNQLLVDLGSELSLGAIDGAAEADLPTLQQTVTGLARGYRPLGPVLSGTISDHLKEVFGPAGVRPAAVSDRVTGHWGLGDGWATHVLTRVALATRDGASSRGDALRTADAPSNAAGVDALVDETVLALAAERGVAVALPGAGDGGLTVDAEALAEVTGGITDALAASARQLLASLGEATVPVLAESDDSNAEVVARVEAELGRDWVRLTAPAFDARRAILIDDRWASAREDVVRIANGEPSKVDLTGSGSEVARIARWYGLHDLAAAAESTEAGAWADDVAVVTGASSGSIAASVVADLLRGGATVVATVSSLDTKRLAFFKQLYRANARVGATLWVVPANMASFQDVDALIEWISTEQTRTLGPKTEVTKPALRPSLLFPFAAGRVMGSVSDAGSRAEVETRILLWSVERLVGADWPGLSESDRLHVVLPGSPNRGLFGGDGAYGETKAALDALVAKSSREAWGDRVTLAHAIIGWVRGTGLMGGNDPLVAAVEAAGVRTWTPDEMAAELLALCTPDARRRAVDGALSADFAEGLENVDLGSLDPHAESSDDDEADGADSTASISALPPSPAALTTPQSIAWGDVNIRLEDMVVVVGAGELGPYGSSRTRYDAELADALSATSVLELAWLTGLIRWDDKGRTWFDVESGAQVAEADIYEQYRETVADRVGIRSYEDDASMVDHSAPLLSSVFLDQDLSFTAGSEAEARALLTAAPDHTVIALADPADPSGDWTVTRRAGAEIRVPLRKPITRTVGGQIPTGFDPAAWGIPADMIEAVDRVALWNLVCTVDAFLSSGFSPAELMESVHPARVANTQGTGMGGMLSMQSLYIDNLLGKKVPNDLLQEALPNVIAAHVVQSYVGSYGAMIHPVAACATTAVSVEEGVDKIRVGKADVVVAGGFDDLSTEGVVGFAAMSATADTEAMRAQGIEDRRFSRANDRRRGGFVESQGGGTLLLARGDVAARMGLPVLGVIAYAGSFGDGIHQSIPAPGLGALAAGLGGSESMLARALAAHGVAPDDVALISKHDTSTAANDPNESDLHERLATAIGRDAANPLLVVSQKSLTGHAKGGAAAFQLIGLSQVLVDGVVPPNRSLDCVDDALSKHERLVWLREPLTTGPLKAGLVTSLGFGHVAGLVALVHPDAFVAALPADQRETYLAAARARRIAGRLKVARVMLGEAGYSKPRGRRLGEKSTADLEAAVLLDVDARLGDGEVYACS